ncbi:MAG: DUF58 domain-containing protein [Verrucomicrobiota bacterium]|nr:DUF58 domain-containing protein [Verrucomicrobiota bacterium]MCC6819588.1 DUF58 domain-containing protein [Limisphaerales bacterium]
MNFGLKLIYRAERLFSWSKYWTLRRFTRPGQAVLGAVMAAAFMGLDTESSVGYQAFTLLLALLLVAVLSGFYFRARFTVERGLPRFGTVGQTLSYRIAVQSRMPHPQSGLALIEDLADPRPSFQVWRDFKLDETKHVRPFRLHQRHRRNPFKFATVKEVAVPSLTTDQPAEVAVEFTPLRRGIVHFTGVTLARADPLGLFRALRIIPLPQSMLILPKRYGLPPLALPGALKYQPGGVALATNIGQSDEFVSLRDYRRGDPLRHIHWRSWAKTGKPIVKEFEDEFFVRHALILDTFTERPHSEVFEEAVSVAASFACTILTQESLLDLLFVGPQAYCFTTGRGLAHADQMLEILASVRPCHTQPFDLLEQLVLSHSNAVSGCICVLLAWDEPRRQLVRKLKLLGLPVLVLVIRQTGEVRPLDPGPMRDEPERLHALEIGQIQEQLANLR